MPEQSWRILIVEDDYFIASDLVKGFQKAGLTIVGPVPSLSKALACLEQELIHGAVLDIELNGEKVYEVADVLMSRSIPIVFVTGYERQSVPQRYASVPLCLKPVDSGIVSGTLRRLIA